MADYKGKLTMSESTNAGKPSAHGADPAITSATDADAVVVGAGMAGLYLLYRFREMGLSAIGLEAAADVGGTWYWNRYPGARCDIESIDYSYSFDPELEAEWTWSEKYATQPEILAYLRHVADKHDLRRDIRFETRVDHAEWHDDSRTWTVHAETGEQFRCRYYVMATGCLSAPKEAEIDGAERFEGEVYFTSRWPHEGVDFTGKRVAVIGTGSSGIQTIPHVAAEADSVTVYQRTPNFTIPADNGPVTAAKIERYEADPAAYREDARWSSLGVPRDVTVEGAMDVSEEERQRRYEAGWQAGTLPGLYGAFADLTANPVSNETLAEFVRNKIRSIVDDPATAETLCPTSYPILTKRLCLDTDYYQTFNLPNVELVDLRIDPIETITETGIDNAESGSRRFDAIVYATGFDAMTGAILAIDIRGKDGRALADRWADGPLTYLGLTTVGYPNFFMITGPHSPSVLSNMAVSIEQHVEWVTDAIAAMHEGGYDTIEPTPAAEAGWVQHTHDFGDITLFPRANSWYMGANVEGKPRVFLPYIGGVGRYRRICDEVVERGYLGFTRRGPEQSVTNDGVVCRVQPDVALLLEVIAELPTIDSMTPEDARAFLDAFNQQRAPGPEVGEMLDGTFPGADGHDLAYRLYRPPTEGPHPVIVYYHGGGWVLGDAVSDEPLCRDLCVRTDAMIVSVDYRHAPEHRFPAAVDDGWAALQWVTRNAASLGGLPDQLAVAGWSAGGNIAAVVAQRARDGGGPELRGQILLTPVTDSDFGRESYVDNAEGYFLTAAMMRWFWDHYVDPEHRSDPRVAPLRAEDLSGLPPAVIVTCDFDPLRDEGDAYAEALAAAGVPVTHLRGRGHIHTSIGAVDVLPSGAPCREEMARAIRAFFPTSVRPGALHRHGRHGSPVAGRSNRELDPSG